MKLIVRAKNFVKKHDKYISPAALFGGFIIDSLTLQRIDLFFENFVLTSYLVLSGLFIFLIALIDSGRFGTRFWENIKPFLNIALLVVFGGLFSGFIIFYVRSSNFVSSWPFLLILLAIMLSTEYLKQYFQNIKLKIMIFYFALFTYLIFFIPILVKHVGYLTFILSGIVSLVLIHFYIKLLSRFLRDRFREAQKVLKFSIIIIFLGINFMYFVNIIPPIPLSLKEADVYYGVERKGDNYVVEDYDKKFFDYFRFSEKIKIKKGQTLYLFSSIFAPTRLSAEVVHEWEFLSDNKWRSRGEIPYTITGGADRGYRGYTFSRKLEEGLWRVSIKLGNGQVIGRKRFQVEFVDELPDLISKVK